MRMRLLWLSCAASGMAASSRTSLVGGGAASTEGWRGLACGALFGLSSPLLGHPIDTIKTTMQTQPAYARGSAWRTLTAFVRAEGVLALYRGLLPPLLGSSVFRSVQFAVYGWAMAHTRDSAALTAVIPGSAGVQWRVLASGVVASTARALIETPLEFVKVRRQTGQRWLVAPTAAAALRAPLTQLRAAYTGFGVSWARTAGLMTAFFVQVDHLERHHRELIEVPYLGPFLKGQCATTAWVLIWPFEVLKNKIQAGGEGAGDGWLARARGVVRARGAVGLYRGIGPGLLRSIVANGGSMVVYASCCSLLRGP